VDKYTLSFELPVLPISWVESKLSQQMKEQAPSLFLALAKKEFDCNILPGAKSTTKSDLRKILMKK